MLKPIQKITFTPTQDKSIPDMDTKFWQVMNNSFTFCVPGVDYSDKELFIRTVENIPPQLNPEKTYCRITINKGRFIASRVFPPISEDWFNEMVESGNIFDSISDAEIVAHKFNEILFN